MLKVTEEKPKRKRKLSHSFFFTDPKKEGEDHEPSIGDPERILANLDDAGRDQKTHLWHEIMSSHQHHENEDLTEDILKL